ncbi:MAG: hypothetical protein JAZ19_13870 [Candidatus Thiodiazotropha taylori]|nr:hypothetical protein [Candidatus Thiodiazotropha taylori]MCG8038112.1 hypothetical protein [Candidatus Thiodiazotropha taylori]MCG8069012.1 hypothetical protein [Candidatus Thiodiazotropha taylori]
MNRSACCAVVIHLLFIPIATNAKAGVSGNTEFRLQVDNSHFGETDSSVELWNDLYYSDRSSGLDLGIQFAVEAGDHTDTGRLYQCFLRSDGGGVGPDITLGRFENVDSRGFSSLDGISFDQQLDHIGWKLYAGKPRRFEAYWQEDANLILGMFTDLDLLSFHKSDRFSRLFLNLGLEQRWSRIRQRNLHLGLSGERPEVEEEVQFKDFNLAADWDLDDQKLQRMVLDAHYDLKSQGFLRLGYRFFRPDQEPETFRDRYHGFFSMDRQSVLKGVWQLPKYERLQTNFELNGSRQGKGHGGLGLATELIYATGFGAVWDTRVDYLESDDDYAFSGYLRFKQPISASSIVELESVYQKKFTQLSGDNHLLGLSCSYSQRIKSAWQIDLSGEWLEHSERDDEYRLALSVRYEFYQTNVGELP